MSTHSDVKIYMAPKAYELFEERLSNHENEDARKMLNLDWDEAEETHHVIGWKWVKWNPKFEDVKAVHAVLEELNKIVKEDNDKLKDYFYKFIQLEETNTETEITNDENNEYTEDFFLIVEFSI